MLRRKRNPNPFIMENLQQSSDNMSVCLSIELHFLNPKFISISFKQFSFGHLFNICATSRTDLQIFSTHNV